MWTGVLYERSWLCSNGVNIYAITTCALIEAGAGS